MIHTRSARIHIYRSYFQCTNSAGPGTLQNKDDTEIGADFQALQLCKTILSQEEQKSLDISLNVYFRVKKND